MSSLTYDSRDETFIYDAVGNRVRVVDSASGTTEYGRNNLNQYTSIGATTPTYDSNGNLTSSASGEYTYDGGNRLIAAATGSNTAGFAYDALNRQVSRTINGAIMYLIYDGWNLIAEYDSSGAIRAKYIHGARADEILAKIDGSGIAVYYHHGGLGSTAALTNSAGGLLESYHYDAFGRPTIYNAGGSPITGTAYGNRFMFAGKEYLAELSLYDSRNRFYSPELGRFLQVDPLRFGAGDANIYRYVGNRPTNAIDPLGLCEEDDPLGFGPPDDFVDDLTKQLMNGSEPGSDGSGDGGSGNSNGDDPITGSGNLRIDDDGTGSSHGDPHHSNETAYQPGGRSLNADTDPYVVAPLSTQNQGVTAGDRATLSGNGQSIDTVVGDFGPSDNGWGEVSVAAAHAIGVATVDVAGTGPVPNTRGGADITVTVTVYPSGTPHP